MRRWAPLGFIIAIGAGLRFYGLGAKSLWFNEAVSASVLNLPPIDVIARCAEPRSTHPPLYFFILRLSGAAFGSEYGLRAVSAVCGLLTIIGIYFFLNAMCDAADTRLPGGRSAPLLGAALVAINPLQIQLSQQVRNYALCIALVTWSHWALMRATCGDRGRTYWPIYASLAVAAAYAHHLAVLTIAAQSLFTAGWIGGRLWALRGGNGTPGSRPTAAGPLLAYAAVGFAYLIPWLPRLLAQSDTVRNGYYHRANSAQDVADEIFQALCATFDASRPDPRIASSVVAVLGCALLLLAASRSRGGTYLALVGLLPMALMAAFSGVSNRGLMFSRYLAVCQVAWLAALTVVVCRIRQAPERILLGIALIGWSAYWCSANWPAIGRAAKPGMRAAMAYLLANRRPAEPIIVRNPSMFYGAMYYARGKARPLLCVGVPGRESQRGSEHLRDEDLITLDALTAAAPSHVWVVDSDSYSTIFDRVFRFTIPPNWRVTARRSFEQDYRAELPVTVERYAVRAERPQDE